VAVYYPEFGDFCDIAADILGTTPEQITATRTISMALTDSKSWLFLFPRTHQHPNVSEQTAHVHDLVNL